MGDVGGAGISKATGSTIPSVALAGVDALAGTAAATASKSTANIGVTSPTMS